MRAIRFAAATIIAGAIAAPAFAGDGFSMVALGSLGGILDGNLSAYLIHPRDDDRGGGKSHGSHGGPPSTPTTLVCGRGG